MAAPTTTETELRQRLAANTRRIREARGLSPDDVAVATGMPRERYLDVEAGAFDAPVPLEDIARIAVGLGVDVVELFGRPRG